MEKQNYISAKYRVFHLPPHDRIILVEHDAGLEKIKKLSDLEDEPYINVPVTEFFQDQDQHWDWEAKNHISIKEDGLSLLVIGVSPRFEMLSDLDLKEECIDYIWNFGMTKIQAIVYYYCHDLKKTYGTIALHMGIKPQSVNSIFKSAKLKMTENMDIESGGVL